ncbi:MAG TPA: amidohydrolase family protein [Steroidobacteraceae bacterium]|nr:amidohydrolase family protein [Steroidobacteraceae bacterium]
MKVIDTHAHFWDVEMLRYPWIEPGSIFDRTYPLAAYLRASAGAPIERIVFVEADAHPSCSLREAQWVQQLSLVDPRIQGIVARATLTGNEKLHSDLDAVAALPLAKGIRDNIQDHPPGFAVHPAFVQGVKAVQQHGMHFELCLRHHQLAETIELVSRCPEVSFVLDHCAKPDILRGEREPWLSQIRKIASLPNVVCKISGLVTEADWERWAPDQILWYARHAADAFGPERILFGSDWPVNEAAGGYMKWYLLAETLAAPWSEAERENFFYRNAERVYRLTDHD